MAKKKYCNIYKLLVKNEGDMVGHIAYSLYKAEKVAHIKEHKDDPGIDLDDLINKFTESKDNQTSLKYYRGMAEGILQKFIGDTVDDMYEELIQKVNNDLTAHIDEVVAPVISDKISSDLTSQIDSKIVPVISQKERIRSKLIWGIFSSLIAALLAPLVWLLIGAMVNIHKDNPEQKVYDKINQSIGFSQSATTEQQTANFPDSITQKQAE